MICPECLALVWPEERKGGTNARPAFSICCAKGKVILAPLDPPPPPLRDLLWDDDPQAKQFRANIRSYNSAFMMASQWTKLAEPQAGIRQFRIQGAMYHLMGRLLPLQIGEYTANVVFHEVFTQFVVQV